MLPAENVKDPTLEDLSCRRKRRAPAVFAGKAIVAAKNGRLYSLDGAGKLLWKQRLPSGCLAAPAIDRDGDIYVACANGSLLRFSASGKPLWQVELKQELLATPLLAAETLFTVSGAGRVCKIRKKDGVVLKQAELHLTVHASPVWDARRRTCWCRPRTTSWSPSARGWRSSGNSGRRA